EFLYAYMPMGDYADYDGELFLSGVRSAIKTREEVAWGKDIPEEVFRHFVLPIRANNEHLDSSRTVFYRELIDKVKNLSAEEAALEVNRWCHTKVTYRPSDSRTSSPLASMRTAHGRCGEESVFAVAAMRAVGIPARQVYTPRWAHTDDNHAWIEVWTPDGTWKYMGACEPEPKLNMGWFSDPVQRGMLMHTKAFGRYNGKEEFISSSACFTEVNSTENYAPTAVAKVVVKNSDGAVVEGANVMFGIYNYAEFYSCVRRTTDANGEATAVTGCGDLHAYAVKDGIFGDAKISVSRDTLVEVVLAHREGDIFAQEMDIVPPVGGTRTVTVTDEERTRNNAGLDAENKIRSDYEATFMSEEAARQLAAELLLDGDKVAFFIRESRG
ncbi:MAG: transglutaminase domain-containing protein, partial [Rikenellaceae bacterium]